jgi:hypothetical protein
MDAQDVPLPLLVSWSSPVEVDSLVMGRRPQEWRCGVQATHQSAAVVGIAVVAMGEELGKDMSGRAMEHLLQYGDPFVRRAPSLCLATPLPAAIHQSAPLTCSARAHRCSAQ